MKEENKTYQIIRFYSEDGHPNHGDVIRTGLTLEQAQAHCRDESTREAGVWFDGYEQESPANEGETR